MTSSNNFRTHDDAEKVNTRRLSRGEKTLTLITVKLAVGIISIADFWFVWG